MKINKNENILSSIMIHGVCGLIFFLNNSKKASCAKQCITNERIANREKKNNNKKQNKTETKTIKELPSGPEQP